MFSVGVEGDHLHEWVKLKKSIKSLLNIIVNHYENHRAGETLWTIRHLFFGKFLKFDV